MADELSYSSRSDHKRKFEDPAAGAPPARRPTGFSAPIASPSPDKSSVTAPPASYNNVPPPVDGIQLAKQRAQEIAARLFSDAEAKRPRAENGGGADDSSDTGYGSSGSDYLQKPPSQPISITPSAFPAYGYQGSSKKIDIPNGRVGVIIGKGGETIKYLQLQSGAKIQVTRDMDADPNSQTRTVELIGTSEQVSKAEQLINDVLSEAEAGGSGIATARRFSGPQVGAEQFQMKVANDKVGLIIGKGGETIKNMQAKSGARIQVIPLHLPPGDTSSERTVYIDGTSDQIEAAKQLVNEVISVNRVRNPMTGGYPHQGFRPPRPPTNWGPPGAPPMQQPGYGYMQPGSYPGAPPQYMSQPPYGSYPPPASGGFQSGWDQSSNPPAQQAAPGSGYDYYNQQQPQQQSQSVAGSSAPTDNTSYNYGQTPNYNAQSSYGDSAYSQSSAGQQGYGQDSYSAAYQNPGSQQGYSQPVPAPQTGYDQQGYSTAPVYGTIANPTQDGSATTYGSQGGTAQASPAQQAPPVPASQGGYAGQPPITSTASYSAPGTAQSGYGLTPTQPSYASQTPSQAGYGHSAPLTQPSYGQPPTGQKLPPAQAVYGQGQQPVSTQAGYVQPAPVQPGYSHGQPPSQAGYAQDSTHRPPPSGFASGAPQTGYGQQQAYGGATPTSQPSYGQQQQPYSDSYGSGSYSQPPAYSNDNATHAAYDQSAAAPTVPSGVTKTSPS
ncbi:uncharacterized protein [Typha latifolia]|uniref:uncharacterized protein n=1 Tax=Typha latifolia TaxID=4733 RepID=UPI003C2F2DCB